MSKVILALSDALRYDIATANMGFLGHLVETRQASLFKIIGELPSMSRPMYETVHTGVPSSEHGIVANSIVRRSSMPNIFQCVVDTGKVTSEYRNHAIQQDAMLAPLIIEWRECGYTIFVTGDHGINKDGARGGTTPEQREVPLFMIPPNGQGRGDTGEIISHLQIAPTILKLINVPIPETMKMKPL